MSNIRELAYRASNVTELFRVLTNKEYDSASVIFDSIAIKDGKVLGMYLNDVLDTFKHIVIKQEIHDRCLKGISNDMYTPYGKYDIRNCNSEAYYIGDSIDMCLCNYTIDELEELISIDYGNRCLMDRNDDYIIGVKLDANLLIELLDKCQISLYLRVYGGVA